MEMLPAIKPTDGSQPHCPFHSWRSSICFTKGYLRTQRVFRKHAPASMQMPLSRMMQHDKYRLKSLLKACLPPLASDLAYAFQNFAITSSYSV